MLWASPVVSFRFFFGIYEISSQGNRAAFWCLDSCFNGISFGHDLVFNALFDSDQRVSSTLFDFGCGGSGVSNFLIWCNTVNATRFFHGFFWVWLYWGDLQLRIWEDRSPSQIRCYAFGCTRAIVKDSIHFGVHGGLRSSGSENFRFLETKFDLVSFQGQIFPCSAITDHPLPKNPGPRMFWRSERLMGWLFRQLFYWWFHEGFSVLLGCLRSDLERTRCILHIVEGNQAGSHWFNGFIGLDLCTFRLWFRFWIRFLWISWVIYYRIAGNLTVVCRSQSLDFLGMVYRFKAQQVWLWFMVEKDLENLHDTVMFMRRNRFLSDITKRIELWWFWYCTAGQEWRLQILLVRVQYQDRRTMTQFLQWFSHGFNLVKFHSLFRFTRLIGNEALMYGTMTLVIFSYRGWVYSYVFSMTTNICSATRVTMEMKILSGYGLSERFLYKNYKNETHTEPQIGGKLRTADHPMTQATVKGQMVASKPPKQTVVL